MKFRSVLWMALLAISIPALAQDTGTVKKMRDAGSTLMIFPDNDNHLHLDSR